MVALEDQNEELALRLTTILKQDGPGAFSIAASSLRIADLALALQHVPESDQVQLFLALPAALAGEVLEELEPETRDLLLAEASDDHLSVVLSEADADDAVYFLDHLDDERAASLLANIDSQLRTQLEEQWDLPEDCAGRLMQRDIATLRPFNTTAQAIARLRQQKRLPEGPIYIVDAQSRLTGMIRYRELLLAEPDTRISSLMEHNPIRVELTTDQEDMASLLQRYHLGAVPVVDDTNRIRGMVTWDDAVDVIEAEADEDILALAGTNEDLEDNDGIFKRALYRLPYLIITVAGGFIVAKLIDGQSTGLLNTYPLLMAFLPLVPALGGNIGLQCATVTVRSIATTDVGSGRTLSRSMREIGTGTVLAILMSVLCGIGAIGLVLMNDQPPQLAVVIAVSLMGAILVAATLGVLIPLTCVRLHIDPAIAAGPFITMLNDVSGVTIYLLTAALLLNNLGARQV